MSDWWSYRLSDLLLFSEETYFRLFELHNHAVWPLPIVTLLLGLAVIGAVYAKSAYHQRFISLVFVASWLWVGWAFHLQHYATVNWAAPAFALMFFLQAVLLGWFGLIRRRLDFKKPDGFAGWLGMAIAVYAVVLHPLLGPAMGDVWAQSEVFAMAPDPTAIATLGLLMLANTAHRWRLLVIPVLWCLISTITLWAMPNPRFWAPALTVLLVLLVTLTQWRRGRRQTA